MIVIVIVTLAESLVAFDMDPAVGFCSERADAVGKAGVGFCSERADAVGKAGVGKFDAEADVEAG